MTRDEWTELARLARLLQRDESAPGTIRHYAVAVQMWAEVNLTDLPDPVLREDAWRERMRAPIEQVRSSAIAQGHRKRR